MKRLIIITSLSLATTGAWAADEVLGGNPDMYKSPLTDHGPGERMHAPQMGYGDEYGSQLIKQPSDHSHGEEARQPGEGDQYGSVLYDRGK